MSRIIILANSHHREIPGLLAVSDVEPHKKVFQSLLTDAIATDAACA